MCVCVCVCVCVWVSVKEWNDVRQNICGKKVNGERYIFGVFADLLIIYLSIYFANAFRLQNLPAYKSILLKDYLK